MRARSDRGKMNCTGKGGSLIYKGNNIAIQGGTKMKKVLALVMVIVMMMAMASFAQADEIYSNILVIPTLEELNEAILKEKGKTAKTEEPETAEDVQEVPEEEPAAAEATAVQPDEIAIEDINTEAEADPAEETTVSAEALPENEETAADPEKPEVEAEEQADETESEPEPVEEASGDVQETRNEPVEVTCGDTEETVNGEVEEPTEVSEIMTVDGEPTEVSEIAEEDEPETAEEDAVEEATVPEEETELEDNGAVVSYAEEEVPVYTDADTSTGVIAVLRAGDKVHINTFDAAWANITFGELTGYIDTNKVALLNTEAEDGIIRSIRVVNDLNGRTAVKEGTVITFTAILTGFENDVYTAQWYEDSGDGVYEPLEGETSLDLPVTVTRYNLDHNWYIIITYNEIEANNE